MKIIRSSLLILLAILGLVYAVKNVELGDITSATVAEVPKPPAKPPVAETSTDEPLYFCPRDNCSGHFVQFINNATKIHCALFDLDLPEVITALRDKGALVVIDNENYAAEVSFARNDTSSQLSHNKFCIFDDSIVWTGSFNPTFRDNYKNNNNVIVFYSKALAENYEAEFQELWNGKFGKGDRVENPVVYINGAKVENYFCPEDWCANKVLYQLENATKSIHFMTFSFTHDKIGDMLVKKHGEGIEVRGVMEKSQHNDYDEFAKLQNASIDVKWDSNPTNMHHKVFIIDNETVVTGSFNPTKNGDTENDENIVIIHDKEIAARYLEEFRMVWSWEKT